VTKLTPNKSAPERRSQRRLEAVFLPKYARRFLNAAQDLGPESRDKHPILALDPLAVFGAPPTFKAGGPSTDG